MAREIGRLLIYFFSDIAIPLPITHMAKSRAITVIKKIVPQIIIVMTIAVFILSPLYLTGHSCGGIILGGRP